MLELLEKTDAVRRPERFRALLTACEADARGRTGLEECPYPQGALLRRAQEEIAAVSIPEEERQGLAGSAIKDMLRAKRLQALTDLVSEVRADSKAKTSDPAA
jgi:tRNA nucleotidyltransferase (CCA-adding enzyme)